MTFRKRNEELILRNKIISSKESTPFLGMTLDSRLNWEEYIKKLRANVKRALNITEKAAKQAIDIPRITTTRLPYTDYYLTMRKQGIQNWKGHTITVGNMRSN